MASNTKFTFQISLSVLDHLGRHLYRSFATVLGEAISNAWDADARNVWIYIDSNKKGLWIKDDGIGMTADDFQEKFLKIGYSKRKKGKTSKKGRPYIGRKGIGKLALLSCAERITVLSKKKGGAYVGGAIDNSRLDEAITDDLNPQDYALASPKKTAFAKYTTDHPQGTIIRFEGIKDGVRHSIKFLNKIIAFYFRFSLLDKSFKIFLNDEQITHEHLNDLAEKTEFLWKIGKRADPYVKALEKRFSKRSSRHKIKTIKLTGATGFIASVKKPQHLKLMGSNERVGIDLFVNGRLREKDILTHIPTARVVESYLYGQIHFDSLDDSEDRFTSSREGIVADDPKFQSLLEKFRKALYKIFEDWDKWRFDLKKEGDPENPRISKEERASLGLYSAIAKGYKPKKSSKAADKVESWVDDLGADAAFNFESYAECFISENLIRRLIGKKRITLSAEAQRQVKDFRKKEKANKNDGNISIRIRRTGGDLSYLSMDGLANLIDQREKKTTVASLRRDAKEFKPIRDAMAHTALLTDAAKTKLRSVRENIKARVRTLLSVRK